MSPASRGGPRFESGLRTWIERTDWLWTIVGGFYLLAYLYWYVPALAGLPRSLRDPPGQFPWHWSLDFVATDVTGSVLLFLGFRRATELSVGRRGRAGGDGSGEHDGRGGSGDRSRETTSGEPGA